MFYCLRMCFRHFNFWLMLLWWLKKKIKKTVSFDSVMIGARTCSVQGVNCKQWCHIVNDLKPDSLCSFSSLIIRLRVVLKNTVDGNTDRRFNKKLGAKWQLLLTPYKRHQQNSQTIDGGTISLITDQWELYKRRVETHPTEESDN